MVCCAVNNCKCSNDKRLNRNKDVSVQEKVKFFSFPKDEALAKIWLEKCGRKKPIIIKNAHICSKHFKPEHYIRNLQHELLQYSPKTCRKLKLEAVPTENLPEIVETSKDVVEPLAPTEPTASVAPIDVASIDKINSFSPPEYIYDMDANKYAEKATNTDISVLERELCEMKAKYADLQKECQELKENKAFIAKNNLQLQKRYHKLKQENECINKIFTPTQRCKLRSNGKRIKWTADDIAKSIAIYSNGPKAYRFLLKQNHPLPAVSTLKKWAGKVQIDPGFKKESIQ